MVGICPVCLKSEVVLKRKGLEAAISLSNFEYIAGSQGTYEKGTGEGGERRKKNSKKGCGKTAFIPGRNGSSHGKSEVPPV